MSTDREKAGSTRRRWRITATRSATLGCSLIVSVFGLSWAQDLPRVDRQGVVTVLGTGEPVPDAEVYLGFMSRTQTDGNGRFVFRNVPEFPAHVRVVREGYIQTRGSQEFPVRDRPGADFHIEMIRGGTGSVSGRFVDENEDPIVEGSIEAFRIAYRNGLSFLEPSGRGVVATDENGEFSLSDLPPGDYVLEAHSVVGSVEIRTYYPGVGRLDDAVPLNVPARTDQGGLRIARPVPGKPHRFQVRFEPFEELSEVAELIGHPAVVFSMRPRSRRYAASEWRVAFESIGDDAYRSPPIVPGSYDILVRPVGGSGFYDLLARFPVDLVDEDLDLGTASGAGAAVRGRITVMEAAMSLDEVDRLEVRLTAADLLGQGTRNSRTVEVNEFGEFAFDGVSRGLYSLEVFVRATADYGSLPPTAYVASASSGSRDVLADGLRIEAGIGSVFLEVTMATDAVRVEGVVRAGRDDLVPGGRVVLVPRVSDRGTLARFPTSLADTGGFFAIEGVPPGEYGILALDDGDLPLVVSSLDSPFAPAPDRYYESPEFLREYERFAEPVTVEPGLGEMVTARAVRLTD